MTYTNLADGNDDEIETLFMKSKHVFDLDQAVSFVLQILLWCSCWGVVDAVVRDLTGGKDLIMMQFYLCLGILGGFVYYWLIKNRTQTYFLHPKVPEFISLVMSCVGSWGFVNSGVTFIAAESANTEVFVHLIIVGAAAILTVLHHRYRRPNFILDQLVSD